MVTIQDNTGPGDLDRFVRSLCATAAPGSRLPSVRELQQQFSVSPVTVQRVVRQLVMEGRVITRPGDGTYVARPVAAGQPIDHSWQTVILGRSPVLPRGLEHLTHERTTGTISLDNAFPDPSLQAHDLLTKAAARVVRRPEWWDRCRPQGLPHLREVMAAELGAPFTAADVLITPGAQAAIDTVCRTLGRPGDPVVLEDPCYPGAVIAATASGLVPTPVPTDAHGVLPDALADVLTRTGARLVILQPRHANPTGSILSAERRTVVLAIAHEFGCFVVEDDWVRDLDLDGPTGPPLAADDEAGHVVSIRSLSKASAPGLRIASVTARGPVLARLVNARLATDFFVAPIVQATAAELLLAPGWQRHLLALRAALAERRDALVHALSRSAPDLHCTPPRGGVALWCELPDGVDEDAFADAAAGRGVRLTVGRTYHLTEQRTGHVRLAFAKDHVATLTTAAERLGAALTDVS
ncbi:MAG: PLP-dependent aminotransferase family protein [Acidimicrobiales bacterium]